jgi:two-component system, chemotaxis family, CheB/CheR fusion protein
MKPRRRPRHSRARKRQGLLSARATFPVVAVGASAGGLEATSQLLSHIPAKSGIAIVLVQHLAPKHDSSLVTLLSRVSKLPVSEVAKTTPVEANHVYVIPPGRDLIYARRTLLLKPRDQNHGLHMPVDRFMESLAKEEGHRAVGVILSGTGSDGALGLQAIKARGGIAFAQSEESAKYDGMPHAAIATGCTDFVLPPPQIGEKLIQIARHPYVVRAGTRPVEESIDGDVLGGILHLLRSSTGSDFTQYKKGTIVRRIRRRMVLHKSRNLLDYAKFLAGHPEEVSALHEDILIHVTGFFRDAAAFEILKKKVFPRILKTRQPSTPIRIWVPGCATGEEVYSLAICLLECVKGRTEDVPIQIFGTDLNEPSLEKARAGVYTPNQVKDVSPRRLKQFFVKLDRGYQIRKDVRERCVFARQNVFQDPPFSRVDLISCRNVLIYLGAELQDRVIPIFHYALKPGGMLLLGRAETITTHSELFAPLDRSYRIYSRRTGPSRLVFERRAAEQEARIARIPPVRSKDEQVQDKSVAAESVLLARHGPAAVLVNSNLEILQFSGRTSAYLEPDSGPASLSLVKMARESLIWEIRSAVQKSKKTGLPVRRERIPIATNGKTIEAAIEVIPLPVRQRGERNFWVVFKDGDEKPAHTSLPAIREKGSAAGRETPQRQALARLERELEQTRARMDEVIRSQETANEELQSANEEILSRNEELQSINEEMETAKEELQSSNEELTTLNDELEHRHSELSQLNSDLTNLFSSLEIPVLILGRDLRIRRFSPAAEGLFNLMPSDIGRPVSDMRFSATIPELRSDSAVVMETGKRSERQVQDIGGKPHSLRIHPYRVAEGKTDGAVVALVDISALKRASDAIEDGRQYAEAIIEAVQESLVVLDSELRVRNANHSFYKTFQVTPKATVGNLIYDLGNGQWNIPQLRTLLDRVLSSDTPISNFEVEHDFPRIGRKTMMLRARQFRSPKGGVPLILLSIQDETERREAEVAAARSGVMSARLMQVQDEERRRVARELHDSTAQSLAGLMMNMNHLSRMLHKSDPKILATLEESRTLADESIREIRTISYLLHPPLLEDAGLASAMRWFVEGFSGRSGIQVKLTMPPQLPRLTGDLELALFRIAQEGLTNVHHHSGSKSARVEIALMSSHVILSVSDNGKGLPAEVWKPQGGVSGATGVGINSMRERAKQLGGTLEFDSSRRGTTVRATLPLLKR